MERLTILYDERCGLCRGARRWLEGQPRHVELEFVAEGSREARRRFPDLDHEATARELTVVDNAGGVYRGAKAWLMCLWALPEYRGAALRLATPALLPYARAFFEKVSSGRHILGGRPPRDGALETDPARR